MSKQMSIEQRLDRLESRIAEILMLLKSKPAEPTGIAQPTPATERMAWIQETAGFGRELIAERDEEYRNVGQIDLWAGKHENEISHKIIGCAIEVHKELGPGLLESVYEDAMCYELSQAGFAFVRQQRVPIKYKTVILSTPLKLDLIVEGKVIVDNKAKQTVTAIDKQALLTYLRLRNVHLGLTINFHELKLVDGVQRIVNNLAE